MTKKNIPTTFSFEIINIEPMTKYISECEIKVLYHGKNRNGSYISKAVGNQIANSLPRTPIVALYNEEIDDYEDHGEEIIINRHGVKFEKKTIPYGAVDQNAGAVWRKFWDDMGIEREYLVVRGYLWTGRYPHLKQVLDRPKGQSLEFFEESVEGNWADFDNESDQLFIINEADVSALCILGDDVEPCFEDASIGEPEFLYSLEKNEFKKEFDNFMFELDKALNEKEDIEGGMTVKNKNKEEVKNEFTEETKEVKDEFVEKETKEVKDEFVEGETKETKDEFTEESKEIKDEFTEIKEEKADDSELVKLQAEYELVKTELEDLKVKYEHLVTREEERDLNEKNEICEKFSVLGDEVLESFKEKINDYTVDELEKELSAIAFKKGITFSLLDEKEETIFTAAAVKNTENVPAWVQAVKKKEDSQY